LEVVKVFKDLAGATSYTSERIVGNVDRHVSGFAKEAIKAAKEGAAAG